MESPQSFSHFPDYSEDSMLSINIAKKHSIEVINLLIRNRIPFSCFQDNDAYKYENHLEDKKQILVSDNGSFAMKTLRVDSDLEAAIKVIHQQITAHISAKLPSIETVTAALNTSPAKFKATFKNMYNMPFQQYFMSYKMKQAQQLLESGQYSVKQISEALGYATPTKFVIIFKKYQNTTPGKIKALAKAQLN